jgi:ATP-dependent Lhr-like helicase
VTEIVRGWLECTGPATVAQLAAKLRIDETAIDAALLRLETQGQVLHGRFLADSGEEQWCNRRVLARIHRRTIGRLRREIEPVTSAQYVAFLHRWQHVAPTARLHGIDGTLQIVKQLEGYEIPAVAWEGQVLPARVAGYKPEYLDRLCYSGDVMWGRLSPHPALVPREDGERRGVRPTRLAPIGLFLRNNAQELIVRRAGNYDALSAAAREVLECIEMFRAPFFAEIVKTTKRLASEVEEALWQLVAAGLVTADGFDALRSLSDAKRRLGEKGLRARPRSSSGRWTLMQADAARAVGHRLSRRHRARGLGAAVARVTSGAATPGGARRDSRRAFRCRIRGRTVRAAGSDRSATRGTPQQRKRSCDARRRLRPLELGGNYSAGDRVERTSSRNSSPRLSRSR